jgi:hypothetical protein
MSSVSTVNRTAQRARHSSSLETLTRTGFVAYGLLHLAIGWLAIQLITGSGTSEADQSGALQLLKRQPLGHAVLLIIAVGLGAMAIWQLTLVIAGHHEYSGARRTAERAVSVGRVLVYSFLMWTDIKVLHTAGTSAARSQEQATAGILSQPAGQFWVAVAGIAVLGIGLGMTYYGAAREFKSKLALESATTRTRQAVLRLGQLGYVARGIAFSVVGVLLFKAAAAKGAQQSRGLDGALRTLAGEPYGPVVLTVIAAGFVAFGVYCFFQARYRKV